MKYQSIFIFIFYLISAHGRLNPQENLNRFATCGQESVHLFKGSKYSSLGTFISSRHALTSSILVMHNGNWIHNNTVVSNSTCARKHIKVPDEVLKTITGKVSYDEVNVIDGYVYCDEMSWKTASFCPLPMVIEMSKDYQSFGCTQGEHDLPVENEDVRIYSYINNSYFRIGAKVRAVQPPFIITNPIKQFQNVGNPLNRRLQRNGGVVSMVTGTLSCESHNLSYYLMMNWYEKALCETVGICKPPKGKLSKEENEQRLKTCGKETVVWFSGNKEAVATRISSRHFLTSASLVMNGYNWSHDGSKFGCSSGYIKVPYAPISMLKYRQGNEPVDFVDAYIFCVEKRNLTKYPLPMVVEVTPELTDSFSCLPTDTTEVNRRDNLLSYSFDDPNKPLYEHDVELIASLNDTFFTIEIQDYMVAGDPLFKLVDDKKVLVGIMSGVDDEGNSKGSVYTSTRVFEQSLCDSTGICAENMTTTRQPTIPTETPSPLPIPPGNPSPHPAPLPPPKPEEPRKDDRQDVDKEYEEQSCAE